jgi:enamine deaminase RidA (YjgF/YER057c/UK114 family)
MRRKLVVVAVAALAPVVAMLGYNEYAVRQQRTEELRAQATQAARQASSEVERIIEGLRSLLTAIASMRSVRRADAAACNDALEALAQKVQNVRTIFVLDPNGNPICGSLDMPGGVTFADRDYFRKAVETRDFVVGGYTKSRISNVPMLPLAIPVLEGEVVTAVVVSGVRLGWLQNRITERGVAAGNAVTLADGAGTIVAMVPLPVRFVGTKIPEEHRNLVDAAQPGTVEVMSQDGTRRILGYRSVSTNNPLYVSAGFSTAEAFAPINRSTVNNSIGIVVGALVALFLAVLIGDRFLVSPMARIFNVVNVWRRGGASRPGARPPREEWVRPCASHRPADVFEARPRALSIIFGPARRTCQHL